MTTIISNPEIERTKIVLFHGTHLDLHRGAILLDHRVGTFIGWRRGQRRRL